MSEAPLRKKVLIVEDEDPLSQVLTEELVGAGFSVSRAADGEAGLAMARAEHPDLILLDLIMPKMDGVEMMRRLREDAWGKDVKIILLTNLGMDGKLTKAIQDYKPLSYLVKTDWPLAEVVKKVEEALAAG